MITLVKDKKNKRCWKLNITKDNEDDINLDLDLLQYSLTNRFECVKELFNDMCKEIPDFSDWYYDLIKNYIESEYNTELLLEQKENIIDFVNEYIDKKNIDFSSFVDKKKSSSTSILFDENDIRSIALVSTCLKIYSIFQYDKILKTPDNINKQMYDYFITDCKKLNTTDKMFQLIRGRTFRSSVTDRYIWDLIKITTLETPETNSYSVFNFFMKNLVSLLNIKQNPISYLVKVIDDNLRWLMLEVYKEKIVYEESFGSSEDIYGTSISQESFHIYCCNDVITKCAQLSLKTLENNYNLDYDKFVYIQDRLEDIKYIDPSMKLFTLPIISKVLDIPYKYLLTAPPKHIVLISILIYEFSIDTICEEFPIISNFLVTYPVNSNTSIIRSSYKLRDIVNIIEDDTKLFGINSRKLKYDIISPIIGILSSSKKNLISVIDGTPVNKITYNDLENDCINFYTKLYSNKLQDTFIKIREDIYNQF